jgi:hypothetical protein
MITGRRPTDGGRDRFQNDPHWRDCVFFYEHFHGDDGAAIGVSRQTGRTGIVAELIYLLGPLTPAVFSGEGTQEVSSVTTRRAAVQ